MRLGDKEIINLFYGDRPVTKVMLGSQQVWAPAAPEAPSITDLAFTIGNGAVTLSWVESGEFDAVNVYRDGVLFDTVAAGVGSLYTGLMDDGLYEWYVAPVVGEVEGELGWTGLCGNMSGDVWVDAANGSDSNNGSSPQQAVKTLNKAGSLVNQAGMRVVVRGGTYSEYNSRSTSSTYGNTPTTTFTQNGTSHNPCELRSFPGETVIIDGSSVTRPLGGGATDPQRPELLTIEGDYWLVEGWPGYPIHVQNSAGCGVRVDETPIGVTLRYIHSHHHEGSAFNVQSSRYCTIDRCAGYACYSTVNNGETADGVSGGGGQGPIYGSDRLTVSNSFFAYNGDDGVDLITATNGTVYNCVAYKNGYFEDGTPGQGNGNGFKMGGGVGIVHGNVFHNCLAYANRQIGFTFNGGDGVTAEYCSSILNEGHGFALATGQSATDVHLLNNVGYGNRTLPSHNMLYNGVTPATDSNNSWNIDSTPEEADFLSLAWDPDWFSWDEVAESDFAKLAPGSDYENASDEGGNIGYEGTYTPPPPPSSGSADINIASGSDDGYVYGSSAGSSFNNIASQSFFGSPGRTWLRFILPPELQPGMTITEAHLQVTLREASAAGSTVIWAVAADNQPAPVDSSDAVNNHWPNLTSASVVWNLPASTGGETEISPDISAIIQEVIDRPGYQAGNSIVFWLLPGSTDKKLYTSEYGNASYRPILHLEWTADPSGGGSEIEIPAIGEFAYGGYMAGIIDTTKGNIIPNDAYQTGGRYMLIVSPKSLEVAVDSSRQWHNSGVNFAAARTRWNGLAATEAMAAAGSAFEAATYVSGLQYPNDGGSQWYIPAMDELELVYRNLKPTTANNSTGSHEFSSFPGTEQPYGYNPSSDPPGSAYQAGNPTQTSVTAFKSGGTEALPDAPSQMVMTSSLPMFEEMWVQDMNNGRQYGWSQMATSDLFIRPVRRIYLDEEVTPSEVTLTLANGLHDGYGDNGSFSNNITQLAGFGDSCRMFLYWQLPAGLTPGSEILEAKLSLVPRNPETAAGSAFVRAHDVDNAAVPASWANIAAWDDQLTTASVQWDVPAFNSGNYGTRLWSPDIKDVVQEIVDRAGFEEENAILFILMPNAGPSGEKFFYSYEYNSTVRPQLYLKYVPAV